MALAPQTSETLKPVRHTWLHILKPPDGVNVVTDWCTGQWQQGITDLPMLE